jgi:hypothetical protein
MDQVGFTRYLHEEKSDCAQSYLRNMYICCGTEFGRELPLNRKTLYTVCHWRKGRDCRAHPCARPFGLPSVTPICSRQIGRTHGLLPNLPSPRQQKRPMKGLFCWHGGERGIRTPGPLPVNGFQDRRFRPLSHLSREIDNVPLSATVQSDGARRYPPHYSGILPSPLRGRRRCAPTFKNAPGVFVDHSATSP